MTYLSRDDDGALQDDFTRAVAARAQELATQRHTHAMACYSDALLMVRQEQPGLWDDHEAFHWAAAGDTRMMDASQIATWEAFNASDRYAHQQAEHFAADGVTIPQAVLRACAAIDELSPDEQGQLLDVISDVLYPSRAHQGQRPQATPAVKSLFGGLDGMNHTELGQLERYLSSITYGGAPSPNDPPEHRALHEMAASRRLAGRIGEVRAGLK